MNKHSIGVLCICSALLLFGVAVPLNGSAEVNVEVGIGLPGLVIPAPPALIVIPGTYVYYPPDVGVDIFFYHGYWYRPYRGGWFISGEYNGPWRGIAVRRVPHVLRGLPPTYRRVPPGYERVPYGTVRKNWRAWERERHWDRNERGRGERRERGYRR